MPERIDLFCSFRLGSLLLPNRIVMAPMTRNRAGPGNAPTALMKELGYGEGYQYAHDAPEGYIPQEYLPERLRGTTLYEPGRFGFEREIAKRLAWWAELKRKSARPE